MENENGLLPTLDSKPLADITHCSTNLAVSELPTHPKKLLSDTGKETLSRASVSNRQEEIKEVSNISDIHTFTHKSVNECSI